jgi:tetrahydromethanopterin S-methyltransferase subunit E
MKAYFVVTGLLFGVLAALHVWETIVNWPKAASPSPGFLLGMAALILIPAALSWWAWRLLRTVSPPSTAGSERQ